MPGESFVGLPQAVVPVARAAVAHEQEELLADYLPYCKTVRIPAPPPATPPCRGAVDVPFLELAMAGKANALVTGDKDLPSLAGSFSCPILSAEQFLSALDIDR